MTKKVIEEAIVPRCTGRAFKIKKGQVFRVIEYEGKQVLDVTFLNAHNYHEQFAEGLSAVLNSLQKMGGYYRLTKLYSQPPYENVMLTVVDDSVGAGARGGERAGHFISGHCSKRLMELRGRPNARSCSDNLRDALSEVALRPEDIYDQSIFNVWMQSWIDEEGHMNWARPLTETGDFIDFLAEMDVIAVCSVCPSESNPCNDFKAKALKFQVLEEDYQCLQA